MLVRMWKKGTLVYCWQNCKLVQPVWRILKILRQNYHTYQHAAVEVRTHSLPDQGSPHANQLPNRAYGWLWQPLRLGATHNYYRAHSTCAHTDTRGSVQLTQGVPLEDMALVANGDCASGRYRISLTLKSYSLKTRRHS